VTLRALIAGEGPLRWAAFCALERLPGSDVLAALRDYAQSGDASVRRTAIETIGKHPEGRALSATVCAALQDQEPIVVNTACGAAAELGLEQAHDPIVVLLTRASSATRSRAIQALKHLWRPEDFAAVLAIFTKDRLPNLRKEAAWVLHQHASEAHWPVLFELWSQGELDRYRLWAAQLAERFAGPAQARDLERLAHDPNGHVRKAAQRALDALRRRG
jgi:hypothetical protein